MQNKKLNIAFFGSSLVSAYWNGAATYYRGIVRALHARGHQVTFYEPDAYQRQENRDIPDPEYAKVVVYQATEEAVYSMLEDAAHADVVVKASGVGVFDELLEAEVLKLQSKDRLVIFWDVDAPATLDRVESDPADPFRPCIPQYDLILTYGGGDPVVNAYTKLGAKKCVPIYNALDTATHYPVAPEAKFACDLAFLGNRLPDREARVEQFFLDVAAQLPDQQFLIGGSGWHDKPMSANVNYIGHVYTNEHNAFNCTPKAVLNISRESMARYGFSPATRVFEAAGAGACIITDYWEGIDFFFEPDTEILVAKDGEEVAKLLQGLTKERAKAIGEAAYKKVLANHTYGNRADELEQLLLTTPRTAAAPSAAEAGAVVS
ncbi:CgeB family protein [Rufibacter immobilis]|uniref:CgeB family protein n=1 Tax=Rufibacter immobilis TaxID=1348778 RepID=UPI0035E7F8EC